MEGTMDIRSALILAVAIVLAALVNGRIYATAGGEGGVYRLNKFTGALTWCLGPVCAPPTWSQTVEEHKKSPGIN